jgi:hypothetical protein
VGAYNTGGHWIAFIIISADKQKFNIYYKDSFSNDRKIFIDSISNSLVQVFNIAKDNISAKRLQTKLNPEQKDSVSCGLFAIRNIEIMVNSLFVNAEQADNIDRLETAKFFNPSIDELLDLRMQYGVIFLNDFYKFIIEWNRNHYAKLINRAKLDITGKKYSIQVQKLLSECGKSIFNDATVTFLNAYQAKPEHSDTIKVVNITVGAKSDSSSSYQYLIGLEKDTWDKGETEVATLNRTVNFK